MSISKEIKKDIIKNFGKNDTDTGSVEVQCAILTAEIKSLTEHMKINKKDFQSRRGLIVMVNKRKRLLEYVKAISVNRYLSIIEKLGLRK